MYYLIDGHNLIAALPDISLEDPDDEAKLAQKLRGWAAGGRKRRVIIYFDAGLPGGLDTSLSRGPVQVIFAPNNSSADALLRGKIKRVRNPGEYTLVSSDREILNAARARRMPHVRSEAFAEQLDRSRAQPAPPEPSDPVLSDAEVAEWLALFGPPPERPGAKSSPPPKQTPPPQSSASPTEEKKERSPRRRKGKTEKQSLTAAKRSSRKLDPEEVAEWLALFEGDRKI